MEAMKTNSDSERIIWILTVGLFASFTIFEASRWISYILLVISAAIFLIDAAQKGGKIRFQFEDFHIFVLQFCIYCFFTSIWAWDSSLAIEKGITIFEIFICSSILYSHYSKKGSVAELINAIMWAGYAVVLYSIWYYGVDTIRSLVAVEGRLENSFANVNMIGMTAAFSVVLTLHKVLFIDKHLSFSNLFAIPAVIIIAATGTRKGMVNMILGCAILLLIKYKSRSFVISIIKWCCLLSVGIIIIRLLSTVSIFQGINDRLNSLLSLYTGKGVSDYSSQMRQAYTRIGFRQFLNSPVFGIGMNTARLLLQQKVGISTYLHNNYLEMLVNGGIIGFFSYYALYFCVIKGYWYRRKFGDDYLTICAVMIGLLLISDFGTVSYYLKSTYFYFVVFCLELKRLKESMNLRNMR